MLSTTSKFSSIAAWILEHVLHAAPTMFSWVEKSSIPSSRKWESQIWDISFQKTRLILQSILLFQVRIPFTPPFLSNLGRILFRASITSSRIRLSMCHSLHRLIVIPTYCTTSMIAIRNLILIKVLHICEGSAYICRKIQVVFRLGATHSRIRERSIRRHYRTPTWNYAASMHPVHIFDT